MNTETTLDARHHVRRDAVGGVARIDRLLDAGMSRRATRRAAFHLAH
jgi:hypothetical protein